MDGSLSNPSAATDAPAPSGGPSGAITRPGSGRVEPPFVELDERRDPEGRIDPPTVELDELRDHDVTARDRARAALVASCLQQGHVLLHVPGLRQAIRRAYEQSRRFHALDDTAKEALHNERNLGRGWVPLLTEPAYVPGTVARCESFDLARENPPEPAEGRHGVIGPNVWPHPDLLPSFRSDVYGLYESLRRVGSTLFEAFAAALSIDHDVFTALDTERSPSMMRLLHYPGRRGGGEADRSPGMSRSSDVVGISAHTDFEAFTLMHQRAPGLQLARPDGTWVDAPADDDALLVIVGDMLERLTNGHLVATPHRVPDNDWERYSIILFCALDGDAVIEPLPQFVSPSRPARYEPISQAAHISGEVASAVENRDRFGGT